MFTIGVSISRESWSAVALAGSGAAQRVEAAVSVPCGEPFGGPADTAALVSELRAALPGKPLPGAVITLPPQLTYLRPLTLPVSDLRRARAIHLAELEGNLPIEDDEILSDLLPAAPRAGSPFVAVATRRSFTENIAAGFRDAGLRVDRVITDHAASLLLAEKRWPGRDALLFSTLPDILLLRTSGGGVLSARQFPSSLSDSPGEILPAIHEILGDGGEGQEPIHFIGVPPPAFAGFAPAANVLSPAEGLPPSHLAAWGAALAPFLPDVAGGFSLRTSEEAATEARREVRTRKLAVAAAGVAILLALGALEFAKWAEGEKAARARALVRKEFAEAAPDIRSVVQATAQIREKVASLRRRQKELGTDAPAPADLLRLASQSLPQGEIALREVSIERGRMRLAGEAGEAKSVETYRAGLAAAFGPSCTVTVQESEGSAKGTAVRYTILVEQKGEPGAS